MATRPFGVSGKVANRFFPAKNQPAALQFTFPFASQAVTEFPYRLQLQPAGLEWITGIYIDNGSNAQQFTFTIVQTGQTITVPGYSQAVYEVLGAVTDMVDFKGATTGNIDISVFFLNYVPDSANSIWSVLNAGSIIGTVTVNGSVVALPTNSAPVDRSLTTGALNTPQQLMPANATRRLLHIMNPYANSAKANGGVLTVGFGAGKTYGTAGGFDIAPGGSFTFDSNALPTSQIFISATDATCVVSALEM